MPPSPTGKPVKEESCGICCWLPPSMQGLADVRLFVAIMCIIISVQGMYLGFIVGIQTSIERRFEIRSSEIGILLAMYDIGHTISVLIIGHFGAGGHKPKWTGIGVLVSAVAMIGLALPNFIYGPVSYEEDFENHRVRYVDATECSFDRYRKHRLTPDLANSSSDVYCQVHMHEGAYAILVLFQLLAGAAAAPFNTLAYIYIDDNVDMRRSPFYLGLLTSMYAFGPALGFGLSALCSHLYADLSAPENITEDNPNWIGAWWLGFLICAILYLIFGMPLFCFPQRIPPKSSSAEVVRSVDEIYSLQDGNHVYDVDLQASYDHRSGSCHTFIQVLRDLPFAVWNLLKNPIYTSMMFGWIFGAYLVGGYGTYLPKYIENQYHQTPALADLYAGLISIGSVATSTAFGGYILTRFNIGPRRATLYLIITWSAIVATYLIGMALGCTEPHLVGDHVKKDIWNFTSDCNAKCGCESVRQFDPVCNGNEAYFSPCHAGCEYDWIENQWINCKCADFKTVAEGFCAKYCITLPIYIAVTFVGLFIGNLFFMTTMMVILRCVKDEQKSLALSFASCCTNILGFIPSPIIFGALIDTSCSVWHAHCPKSGNCILYNNADFRHKYHLGNAAFQTLAILSIIFTFIKARRFRFPEEEIDGDSGGSNYITPETTRKREIRFADEEVAL